MSLRWSSSVSCRESFISLTETMEAPRQRGGQLPSPRSHRRSVPSIALLSRSHSDKSLSPEKIPPFLTRCLSLLIYTPLCHVALSSNIFAQHKVLVTKYERSMTTPRNINGSALFGRPGPSYESQEQGVKLWSSRAGILQQLDESLAQHG
ncbi:hypothetical protein CRENBAI_003877 [Crenichthys baileyi]|uniref:Uncharacterized protein n=1 Tax=Crenichthys baileyi TaxID=28760 RepID=A0AAV9SSJ7_9TELE